MYLKIVNIDSFYYLKIKLLDLRYCMQKGRKTTYKKNIMCWVGGDFSQPLTKIDILDNY